MLLKIKSIYLPFLSMKAVLFFPPCPMYLRRLVMAVNKVFVVRPLGKAS
jgi:hypothetical protein